MVSTRGVKFKFSEGEKVLCYEPDPTKAKVLYDSKVLDVIVNKDSRGKKVVEYLIHFQGWNSSWDRCVSEDYVLKDTDQNRQLQRDLAERAQLQLGAYLYRRERKKRHRKLSERINESLEQKKLRRHGGVDRGGGDRSSEDGSSAGSHSQQDADDSEEDEMTSSEGESSGEPEEERVPLELSDTLKRVLEEDFELITKKNKIVNLPVEPNVINILEGYVKNFAVNQICGIGEKPQRRYRYHYQNNKGNMDRLYRSLNICKEIVDGVRIYFDFTLSDLLLYNQERQQYEELRKQHQDVNIKQESVESFEQDINNIDVKQEDPDFPFPDPPGDAELELHAAYNNIMQIPPDVPEIMDNGEMPDLPGFPYNWPSCCPYQFKLFVQYVLNDLYDGDGGRKRSLRSSHRTDAGDSHVHESNGIGKAARGSTYGHNSHDTVHAIKQEAGGTLPLNNIKMEPGQNTHNLSSIASTSSRCSTPTTIMPHIAAALSNQHSGSIADSLGIPKSKHSLLLSQVLMWQLVPRSLRPDVPVPPSFIYGAIHLARLFVKLPDLLYAISIPERKLKVLLRHLDMFLSYMESHHEWFGPAFYKDNDTNCE